MEKNKTKASKYLELYKQGYSLTDIARMNNITRQSVHFSLKHFPEYKSIATKNLPYETQTKIEKITALAAQGKTKREVARILGIPYHTLISFSDYHKINFDPLERRQDLTGETIYNWKFIRPLGYKYKDSGYTDHVCHKYANFYWEAQCLGCHNFKEVRMHNILQGRSKSCLSCAMKREKKIKIIKGL